MPMHMPGFPQGNIPRGFPAPQMNPQFQSNPMIRPAQTYAPQPTPLPRQRQYANLPTPQNHQPTWNPAPVQQSMPPTAFNQPRQNIRRPAPIIRAQNSDESSVQQREQVTLSMPTPEALGISLNPTIENVTRTEEVDWNMIWSKLRSLGVSSFHLDKLANGSFRVVFTLPTQTASGQSHVVEVIADSEATAVRTALQRAQQQVVSR